ncbi:Mrp/NBP35 family ATP-binding protein [Emergencia sp. 1XD21-10]|uniref:Mrp/NBP35 family ATP-binding protein n=1 Tax=Emergencia sp. 1XD21-10 TaxID=2304569 RepID=UPI00137B546E|nr:Mrp/NBP35 family ATP-binding protein [Emergencia sp. 1XD21-10]NCF00121.1 ATP-binding protein [Emergencia sp. 1XD21-10]
MSDCNHDCGSCSATCGERQEDPGIKKAPMNDLSDVRKVIGVVSGKGGVGKSSVTSMLAVAAKRQGKNVAILDADITGPSIPKAFGLTEKAQGNDQMILPSVTGSGIKAMSINLLLENETDPVVWRGPILGGVIEQFWSDICWGDVDVMFVDMPPGTGDVALTVYQSLPVDGIIIVTSPQELVGMIVEKAVKMAELMDIPVLGIVENMSYFKCPSCNEKHMIFGESHIEEVAAKHGIPNVAKLPMDMEVAKACDSGRIEDYVSEEMERLAAQL